MKIVVRQVEWEIRAVDGCFARRKTTAHVGIKSHTCQSTCIEYILFTRSNISHADIFGVQKFFDSVFGAFFAYTRLLHSPEWSNLGGD